MDRLDFAEAGELIKELNPYKNKKASDHESGDNRPLPKGRPFRAEAIIDKVFKIADENIPDDEITEALTLWINQENLSFLSKTLEKRNAPLGKVVEVLNKYFRMTGSADFQSYDERIGLRVSLIGRLLSENLNYINVAKNFVSLTAIKEKLSRIVGPENGTGKVGGKSAGLILAKNIIESEKSSNPLLENIRTPKSWYLTSDEINEFVHYNALEEFIFTKYMTSEEIKREYPFVQYIFKSSHFPPELLPAFNRILDDLDGRPIIVRSSSLLEDSFEATFSGKYKSLFLSNKGTREEQLNALTDAIAEIYASALGPDPIEYRKERGLIDFREEMAILIQEVVGNKIGKYFMPSYAGAAFSNNDMRWSPRLKREDGVVRLVCGLGTRAVDRTMNDYPALISPGQPGLRVNQSYLDTVRYTQQFVDVINLETNNFETVSFEDLFEESGGFFPGLDKIVSFNRQGMMVDPVSALVDFSKEELIVSFNSLISKTDFIKKIKAMLDTLRDAFKSPVDLEFASDGERIFLLQCRPQSRFEAESVVRIPKNIPEESKIFTANRYVSSGLVKNVEYVVYVDCEEYSAIGTIEEMQTVGKIVGKLNSILPKRKFVLIGPGRWGSKGDIKLGVPVIYSDINNTAALIEVARDKSGHTPELSFGTHFFQDLVEANIKYLPLYPDKEGNVFNQTFFACDCNKLPEFLPEYSSYEPIVKVIKTDACDKEGKLSIYMDGDNSEALAIIV